MMRTRSYVTAGRKLMDLAFTVICQELRGFVEEGLIHESDVGLATEYRLVVLTADGRGTFTPISRPLGVVSRDYAYQQATKARSEGDGKQVVTVQARVILRGDWERDEHRR